MNYLVVWKTPKGTLMHAEFPKEKCARRRMDTLSKMGRWCQFSKTIETSSPKNKTMKRTLTLLLIAQLSYLLCGCGKKPPERLTGKEPTIEVNDSAMSQLEKSAFELGALAGFLMCQKGGSQEQLECFVQACATNRDYSTAIEALIRHGPSLKAHYQNLTNIFVTNAVFFRRP